MNLLAAREGQNLHRDPDANNSIRVTWQISFNHLQKTSPAAAELLSLMSFFGGKEFLALCFDTVKRHTKHALVTTAMGRGAHVNPCDQ